MLPQPTGWFDMDSGYHSRYFEQWIPSTCLPSPRGPFSAHVLWFEGQKACGLEAQSLEVAVAH